MDKDEFGQLLRTFEDEEQQRPLSVAQGVALQCRDDACRALVGLPRPSPCLPPVLGREGAVRLLCDAVSTAALAHEPLRLLLTLRALLKRVGAQFGLLGSAAPDTTSDFVAARALYDVLAQGTPMHAAAKRLKPVSLALWGTSLVCLFHHHHHQHNHHRRHA